MIGLHRQPNRFTYLVNQNVFYFTQKSSDENGIRINVMGSMNWWDFVQIQNFRSKSMEIRTLLDKKKWRNARSELCKNRHSSKASVDTVQILVCRPPFYDNVLNVLSQKKITISR